MPLPVRMKIHVIGGSALGYFIAHALKNTSRAPITLHFHKLHQADTFNAVYGLNVINASGANVYRDGFGYEMKDGRMRRAVPYIPHILDAHRRKEYVPAIAEDKIRMLPEEASHPPKLEGSDYIKDSVIKVLIVAKRPLETLRVIKGLRHRLKRSSTIVLVHNGMGILSQVQELWDEPSRPNILEGFSTHALSKRDEFSVDHVGAGMIRLAIAPRLDEHDIFSSEENFPPAINSRYCMSDPRLQKFDQSIYHQSLAFVVRQLLYNQALNCILSPYIPQFYVLQLRRTVLQSIIQLIATILRCTNAEIMQLKGGRIFIGRLLSEIIPLLHQDPLIASSPELLEEFSFRRLYVQIHRLCNYNDTPPQTNSLLQDIMGRRETELFSHAGYFVSLATQKGIEMPRWKQFLYLVKTQAELELWRNNNFVPVTQDGKVVDLPEWMDPEISREVKSLEEDMRNQESSEPIEP